MGKISPYFWLQKYLEKIIKYLQKSFDIIKKVYYNLDNIKKGEFIMVEKIKNYMARHGINQKQFAELCGIHYTYLSCYMNGKRIPADKTLRRIKYILNKK